MFLVLVLGFEFLIVGQIQVAIVPRKYLQVCSDAIRAKELLEMTSDSERRLHYNSYNKARVTFFEICDIRF